jgi:hypothetical protein
VFDSPFLHLKGRRHEAKVNSESWVAGRYARPPDCRELIADGGGTSRLRRLNRLKPLRRIATRYEKRAVNDKAMLTLAAILLWL